METSDPTRLPEFPTATRDRLAASSVARAENIAVLRRRLTAWLRETGLDADTVDDLVLATSEALENVCDHAFTTAEQPGTMTLSADIGGAPDPLDPTPHVVITVTDDGAWQPRTDEPTSRGRGLSMIGILAAHHTVTSTLGGTVVTLAHPVAGVLDPSATAPQERPIG
ncbi:ATP-binding protein [Actinomycetospora sp.]|jgi:anti-sigma regulatory factor (Ser/Thr protein kinase)|uniref:ATP-binding protein n=1 Tax=Actinomycetospora sp. TaxID=1872135 RepID=UPI002F428F84